MKVPADHSSKRQGKINFVRNECIHLYVSGKLQCKVSRPLEREQSRH